MSPVMVEMEERLWQFQQIEDDGCRSGEGKSSLRCLAVGTFKSWKPSRLKDFTAFLFIFRLLFRNLRLVYRYCLKRRKKHCTLYIFFHPEETKPFFLKHSTAGKTIREMLYRFPISIYIIFSRLRHPRTLAALVHLRSSGKKKTKTQKLPHKP